LGSRGGREEKSRVRNRTDPLRGSLFPSQNFLLHDTSLFDPFKGYANLPSLSRSRSAHVLPCGTLNSPNASSPFKPDLLYALHDVMTHLLLPLQLSSTSKGISIHKTTNPNPKSNLKQKRTPKTPKTTRPSPSRLRSNQGRQPRPQLSLTLLRHEPTAVQSAQRSTESFQPESV